MRLRRRTHGASLDEFHDFPWVNLLSAQPLKVYRCARPVASRSTLQAGVQSDLRVVKLGNRATGFGSFRGLFKRFLGCARNFGFQLQVALRDSEASVRFVQSDFAG